MVLNPVAMSECYGLFWDHTVKAHGLNPDTSEFPPGIESASFYIDLDQGSITVDLAATQS